MRSICLFAALLVVGCAAIDEAAEEDTAPDPAAELVAPAEGACDEASDALVEPATDEALSSVCVHNTTKLSLDPAIWCFRCGYSALHGYCVERRKYRRWICIYGTWYSTTQTTCGSYDRCTC